MCRLSWFLDPGGWSKTAVVRLYFIFPGICTLSLNTATENQYGPSAGNLHGIFVSCVEFHLVRDLTQLGAAMLLQGMKVSLLLVQRTVTRTIVLQETIGKDLPKDSSGQRMIRENASAIKMQKLSVNVAGKQLLSICSLYPPTVPTHPYTSLELELSGVAYFHIDKFVPAVTSVSFPWEAAQSTHQKGSSSLLCINDVG
ncbi:hypothetical protein STEG23_001938 [Scotinomys teguina]